MQSIQDAFRDAARYSVSAVTGAIGASGATKNIFYAQWTSTTQIAMIESVVVDHIATTAYAAGQVLYQLFIARAFTAEAGTTHGTALTLTTTNQRLQTAFPTTGFAVIRVSDTTAAGMTAGTWALDSNPVGQLNSHSSAGVGAATPIIGSQYLPNNGILFRADVASGEYPIVLRANEGIVIQATVPATGVGIHGITMKWAETDRVNL